MHVYLDNAASTPLDPQVLEAMLPYMQKYFGNPSSIHTHGREARSAIEKARKTVASLLNTSPSEIFFTSGGTEADNIALVSGIRSLGITNAITTPIEHHAVLHTLEYLARNEEIMLSFAKLDDKGRIDLDHLEKLLASNPNSLVSIMHANNEIGNINQVELIGELCSKYKVIFHSDTVQTVGHYSHDLQKLKVDFIAGAAHKFHGPKGIGFLYINAKNKISPLIHGGSQERNMRGGTENIYGIIGLAKSLEIAYANMKSDRKHIEKLKKYLVEQLQSKISGIIFNGNCLDMENSLYTVLNISTPIHEINEMVLFNLDIEKISVSGGSACASGSEIGSHVLRFLNADHRRAHIRFSFSKFNTKEEIDYVVEKLEKMYN